MDDATRIPNPPFAAAPWYARRGFWRAVAGMALTVAMACAIVRMEMLAAGRRHRRRHPAGHREQAYRGAPPASRKQ